jgi:hypothetical protein
MASYLLLCASPEPQATELASKDTYAHLEARELQVAVVYGVILGAVVDVWHLADVKLLLLLVEERLEQLAPPEEPQHKRQHSQAHFC